MKITESIWGLLLVAFLGGAGWLAGCRHRQAFGDAQSKLASSKDSATAAVVNAARLQRQHDELRDAIFAKQAELLHLYEEQALVSRKKGTTSAPRMQNAQAPHIPHRLSGEIDAERIHSCRTPLSQSTDPKQQLPIFVFVCGVEGAGHHALETVWEELENYVSIGISTYQPGLHSFAKAADVSRAYQFPTIKLATHEQRLRNFLRSPSIVGRPLIISTRDSYPEGFGVGNLAHPDLVFLSEMDGKLFDLRVLVLHRDPVKAVLSSVRRFKVKEFQYKNYQYQARSVQESLTMINNGLAAVPCGKALLLPYAELLESPRKFSEPLAKLLSVDSADLSKCFSEIKAPTDKTKELSGNAAKMHSDLSRFFVQQAPLFPLFGGGSMLSPLNISTPILRGHNVQHRVKNLVGVAEVADVSRASTVKHIWPKRYLKIQWFTNLGFNNMRFILEEALYLSALLDRRLVLPTRLRMRRCTDEDACAASGCTLERGKYWCPLTAFVSWPRLAAAGGVIIEDAAAFAKFKSKRQVPHAFDDMFSKETLYLDRLPPKLSGKLNGTHQYTPPSDGPPLKFTYWSFHLGCELSYFKAKKQTWSSDKAKLAGIKIHGFVDDYSNTDEDVLFLEGTPHHIGLTPTFWSSYAGLETSASVWNDAVVYHSNIKRAAKAASKELMRESGGTHFMCVHFRRGDFVDAGWLGKASNLSVVKKSILDRRLANESVYIATDETDPEILAELRRDVGARFWADVQEAVSSDKHNSDKAKSYLGFEDYVGLIEQMICGGARTFVGSDCSSFTGGILNIRRRELGDESYTTTSGKDKTES